MSSQRKGTACNHARTLLRNVIKHTDTHNRLLEEAEMWSLHTKMKDVSPRDREDERPNGQRRHDQNSSIRQDENKPNVKKSFLFDDRQSVSSWPSNGRRRAHMDDDDDRDEEGDKSYKDSTFWLRKLYKAEADDEDRWGHAGYKELYPNDFQCDRSKDSNYSSSSNSDGRKRKRKKLSARETHRKEKRKKERQKKKKDSSDESSEEDDRKRKKRKRKDNVNESTEKKKRKSSGGNKEVKRHKRKKRRK